MLSRRVLYQVVLGVVLSSLLPTIPIHAALRSFRVTLDGRPTTLAEASRFHCHDLVPFELRCFRAASARDRSLESYLTVGAVTYPLTPTGSTSSGYVVAYAAISYGGSSVVLSQSHANLGAIGWNNVISSYKVFTSVTGAFYEFTNYVGRQQQFCCYRNVSYVGDALNDTFSSFALP